MTEDNEEKNIDDALSNVLSVFIYPSDTITIDDLNIWHNGRLKATPIDVKEKMLGAITKALCIVDSDILVRLSHQIDEVLLTRHLKGDSQ